MEQCKKRADKGRSKIGRLLIFTRFATAISVGKTGPDPARVKRPGERNVSRDTNMAAVQNRNATQCNAIASGFR